jgi:hypothetical protein
MKDAVMSCSRCEARIPKWRITVIGDVRWGSCAGCGMTTPEIVDSPSARASYGDRLVERGRRDK